MLPKNGMHIFDFPKNIINSSFNVESFWDKMETQFETIKQQINFKRWKIIDLF